MYAKQDVNLREIWLTTHLLRIRLKQELNVNFMILRPLDRAIWWIEHIMRHPFMYEGKSPVHKLYWFQYFLLDVLALYLLILYAVFKIVKFFVCKLFFKSNLKPKNDWAYIWKRLCDFIIDDISLSKNSIKLLECIHCILSIEGHLQALLHSQIGQPRQPLLTL